MRSRILVADDEPHIREVVRAYLEREGYEVLEAADGETALEHGRSSGLDLLVLDVMLPGGPGSTSCAPCAARARASAC